MTATTWLGQGWGLPSAWAGAAGARGSLGAVDGGCRGTRVSPKPCWVSPGVPQAEPLLPEERSGRCRPGNYCPAKIFLQMPELGHVHHSDKTPLRAAGDPWEMAGADGQLSHQRLALNGIRGEAGWGAAWGSGGRGPRFSKAAIKRGRPECFWGRPRVRGVSQGSAGEGLS